MKRILLILVLLLLVGCSAKTSITEVRPSEKTVQTTYIYELDDAIMDSKTETESKQNIGYKTILEINNKKAKVGDYVVFGLILNNLKPQTDSFLVDVEFWEAKDDMNNKIEVDENTIKEWLIANNFKPFVLEHQESEFIPIIIKVGNEIKPGVKTVKGSYKFIVKTFSDVKENSKKSYDSDKTLFLAVEP